MLSEVGWGRYSSFQIVRCGRCAFFCENISILKYLLWQVNARISQDQSWFDIETHSFQALSNFNTSRIRSDPVRLLAVLVVHMFRTCSLPRLTYTNIYNIAGTKNMRSLFKPNSEAHGKPNQFHEFTPVVLVFQQYSRWRKLFPCRLHPELIVIALFPANIDAAAFNRPNTWPQKTGGPCKCIKEQIGRP